MTDTFDPADLTVEEARNLGSPPDWRELRVALAYWVFGDDLTANTEKRIVAAINTGRWKDGAWRWNGKVYSWDAVPWLCPENMWSDRHSEKYQSDLEAHVAAWRAEPPEETNDLAVSMFDEGMPLFPTVYDHVEVQVHLQLGRALYAVDAPEFDEFVTGPTFSTAILRAALVEAVSGRWKPEPKGGE